MCLVTLKFKDHTDSVFRSSFEFLIIPPLGILTCATHCHVILTFENINYYYYYYS